MCKKLSNTAERLGIEKELNKTFKYPKLYQSNPVINGTEETSLPIIISEDPDHISYGIWGLLPEGYKESWIDFQNAIDTLSVYKSNLKQEGFYKESFKERRCLIIVTGFFIYHLNKGSLYPYYVYQKNHKPFCIAGIYNVLEDGFITCSLITTQVSGMLNDIENVDKKMPVVVPKHLQDYWLDTDVYEHELFDIIDNESTVDMNAHPIAKEFFRNNINFKSMLEPVAYQDTPGKK